MGHYLIIGIIVLLIIGVQIYFFSKTSKEIRKFSNIFPKSTDNLYAHDSEIYVRDYENKIDYDIDDKLDKYIKKHDSVFERIISSLNTYLRKIKALQATIIL